MNATIEKQNGKTKINLCGENPLKILQLTDIHLGGGVLSKKQDALALSAVEKIVNKSDPDLIVVTGDICYPFLYKAGTHNNMKACNAFGELMTRLNRPWTFVFGNHDGETFAKYDKRELADYFESLPNCLFEKGEPMQGLGNYSIPVYNADGSLNTVLMFLDSNSYLSWHFFSGFDTIHQDQIDWYKNEISSFGENGDLPQSIAFFHIPPKEFKEGWDKCVLGKTDEVTYHSGFVQEKDNYFGYPKTVEGTFIREMIDFGSMKGFFCGHDHLNTLSITYKGIRMTYGMSIDYLAYRDISNRHTQRGGTLILLSSDKTFDVRPVPLSSC